MNHETMTTQANENPAASTAIQTAPAAPPATSSVARPPPASIPAPPSTFTPATPGEFKNVAPRQSELAAMPQALLDLARFAEFDQVFGRVAPSQAELNEGVEVAALWSAMRQATSKWDEYCVLQEGYAWRTLRALIARSGPAFLLAAQGDPAIVTTYPGLAALLGAKRTIAQKGASTRRLNDAAVARGEPPIHGAVGRRRQRKLEKEALAKAASAKPATPPTS